MLSDVVLDRVEIGERGQVRCRVGSLDKDLGAGVFVGPGGADSRRDADERDELPGAVAADRAEPGVVEACFLSAGIGCPPCYQESADREFGDQDRQVVVYDDPERFLRWPSRLRDDQRREGCALLAAL